MSFQSIKATSLPQLSRGRKSTDPRVTVTNSGRIQFNTFISRLWTDEGITRVLLRFDPDQNRIACQGLNATDPLPRGFKPEDVFQVVKDKKNGLLSIGVSAFFAAHTEYKYEQAGNQTYAPAVSEQYGYVFTLPRVTPPARPKLVRVARKQAAQVNTPV